MPASGAHSFGLPSFSFRCPSVSASTTIASTLTATTNPLASNELSYSMAPVSRGMASSPVLESMIFKPIGRISVDETEKIRLLQLVDTSAGSSNENTDVQEVKTAPLFSSGVRQMLRSGELNWQMYGGPADNFPQYGFLGVRTGGHAIEDQDLSAGVVEDKDMIFANMNAPWSAFICGSQGSGKSHTLSCIIENSLLASSLAGNLPNPLAGIVFHYDKFTSHASTQLCEAAYLCSAGVPVRVLVSPSNVWAMTKLYTNLPGLAKDAPRPKILPLYLREDQLNVSNMMALMAVNAGTGTPLYLEVLYRILRDMAMEKRGAPGLSYHSFKARLDAERFTSEQNAPLRLRLQLLESFMDPASVNGGAGRPKMSHEDIWKFEQGSLTIVDLSCPFVNENDACALFSICLSLFLEERGEVGRVVVLDEAHKVNYWQLLQKLRLLTSAKFLTQSGEALEFTDQLVSVICQQRHLATRVLVATQEPTLSPRLLDLCNVTIVHRFLSPAWFKVLKGHLAGAAYRDAENKENPLSLFSTIVKLKTGEALVFSPTSMLDVDGDKQRILELGDTYFKIRIRKRLTADGGKSIMASDKMASFHEVMDVPIQELSTANAPTTRSSENSSSKCALHSGVKRPLSTEPAPKTAANVKSTSHKYVTPAVLTKGISDLSSTGLLQPHQPNQARIYQVLQQEAERRVVNGTAQMNGLVYLQVRKAAAVTLGLAENHFEEAGRGNINRLIAKAMTAEKQKQVKLRASTK